MVVPRNKVADFVKFTKIVEAEEQIRIRSFGHAGDGNLHVYMLRDDLSKPVFIDRLNKAFDRFYAKAKEMGGQVSGEHGIGFAKKPYLETVSGMVQLQLMKQIKMVF